MNEITLTNRKNGMAVLILVIINAATKKIA